MNLIMFEMVTALSAFDTQEHFVLLAVGLEAEVVGGAEVVVVTNGRRDGGVVQGEGVGKLGVGFGGAGGVLNMVRVLLLSGGRFHIYY